MEDRKIVELYLSRDEAAISETSGKYSKNIRSAAFRITGDTETSLECENDTYLKVWDSIPPNEPYEYFLAFLLKITRGVCINRCISDARLKRSAYIVELSSEMQECIPYREDVESEHSYSELCSCISRFLRLLPKQKRVIFMHRYYFLDSISNIAARFDMSKSNVKTTLFRIREDLRSFLNEEGYDI